MQDTGLKPSAPIIADPCDLEHHPIERGHPSGKDARQNKELEHLQRAKRTENALGTVDRRRPGRRDVLPAMIALLRGPAITIDASDGVEWTTGDTEDVMAPARGILVGLMISVPLWALIAAGAYAVFG